MKWRESDHISQIRKVSITTKPNFVTKTNLLSVKSKKKLLLKYFQPQMLAVFFSFSEYTEIKQQISVKKKKKQ